MILVLRHGFGFHHLLIGPIVLVVVGVLIYLAIARSRQKMHGSRQTDLSHDLESRGAASNTSAERILSERFAQGEIGLDDYRARLAALRETGIDPGNGLS